MSDIPKQYEESDSAEKLLSIDDVWLHLQTDALLEKPYHRWPEGMKNAILACNISEDIAKVLERVRGRVTLHLLRMLRRSEVERNFSLAYLQHCDDILQEDQINNEIIMNVINSEWNDTMMFWTFAPYLFKDLTEKGVLPREAIKKILFWSKDWVSCWIIMNEKTSVDMENRKVFNLKGLEKYENACNSWILSEDPHHISHKYTAQEAKRIADLLLATQEDN